MRRFNIIGWYILTGNFAEVSFSAKIITKTTKKYEPKKLILTQAN